MEVDCIQKENLLPIGQQAHACEVVMVTLEQLHIFFEQCGNSILIKIKEFGML